MPVFTPLELTGDPTTHLAAALTDSATTISVADASKLPPTGGYCWASIDAELVKITGPSTIARGELGTTPAPHNSGAALNIVVVPQAILDLVAQSGQAGPAGPKGDPGDPATNLVTSVAGKQGVVTLAKSDVGLGSVDNTADTAKPVSTAQAAADALKVAKAGDTMTGALKLPAGSVAAPSLAVRDANTGIYSRTAKEVSLVADGVARVTATTVGAFTSGWHTLAPLLRAQRWLSYPYWTVTIVGNVSADNGSTIDIDWWTASGIPTSAPPMPCILEVGGEKMICTASSGSYEGPYTLTISKRGAFGTTQIDCTDVYFGTSITDILVPAGADESKLGVADLVGTANAVNVWILPTTAYDGLPAPLDGTIVTILDTARVAATFNIRVRDYPTGGKLDYTISTDGGSLIAKFNLANLLWGKVATS